jgi:hypothetical protein
MAVGAPTKIGLLSVVDDVQPPLTTAVNVAVPLPVAVKVVDEQEVQLGDATPEGGLMLQFTEVLQGKLAMV